jgi:membrane protein required for colicin V production
MNGADWIIVSVIAISCVIGAWRGFMREAISVAAWVLGIWLAWTFASVLEPHLGGLLAQEQVRVWVARLIILVSVVLLGVVVGFFATRFARYSPFGTTDRILGILFGFVRGAIIVGLFAILARLVQLNEESWWKRSALLPYAAIIGDWMRSIADDVELPEAR